MLIAIDIDSTLHHYWDVLSAIAEERFGIDLPYEEQVEWGIKRLRPEQVQCCVDESHRERRVLEAVPYEGAVDVVNRWGAIGHSIHVMSHRSPESEDPTRRWLDGIGLRYDELDCVMDKVALCRELGAGLLIDDHPENLEDALSAGILAATIEHPWNREVRETEDVISAPDWHRLATALAPHLVG